MPCNNETRQQLVDAAMLMWDEIEDDVLENLLESMPRRLKACYDAKGWYTRY